MHKCQPWLTSQYLKTWKYLRDNKRQKKQKEILLISINKVLLLHMCVCCLSNSLYLNFYRQFFLHQHQHKHTLMHSTLLLFVFNDTKNKQIFFAINIEDKQKSWGGVSEVGEIFAILSLNNKIYKHIAYIGGLCGICVKKQNVFNTFLKIILIFI